MEKFKKDCHTDKLLKDRGDNLRKIKLIPKEKVKYEPDRGDSLRNKSPGKTSESDKRSKIKREYVKPEPLTRQREYETEPNRIPDRRRQIRDKYTIKNYILSDVSKHVNNRDLVRDSKKGTEVLVTEEFIPIYISQNTQKHTEAIDKMNVIKYTKEKPPKVPVIKTITSKKDAKVYKAVTFRTPKSNPTTPLHINVPTATMKNTRIPKLNNQNKIKTKSKTSVKPDSERKKTSERKSKRWHIKDVSSAVLIKDGDTPSTEIAKWAPNCINKHTKPYYEAWVDTTLAATLKNAKNNKFIDERNPFWTFGKELERIKSPEMVYKDEFYAGKIKVNHKQ